MRRRPLLAGTLLTVALALGAGCGGDDAPTPAEYRADARKVCADAKRATSAVRQPTRATPAAIVDYFERLLRASERSTERFRDLEPPDELRAAHDEALKVSDQVDAEVRRVVRRLQADEEARTVLADARGPLQRLRTRSAAAAKRLGVPECADS